MHAVSSSSRCWITQVDVHLVCPNCRDQTTYGNAIMGWNHFTCPNCKKSFQTLIATVRAKRSRGSRKHFSREFYVRVYINNLEELIQFTSSDYDDFELRSSDAAAFSYRNDRLTVVQNLTIGRHKIVRQPELLGCISVAFIIFGIIIIIIILAAGRS